MLQVIIKGDVEGISNVSNLSGEKWVEFYLFPIGETTAFALTLDGYNLIDMFTRKPSVL